MTSSPAQKVAATPADIKAGEALGVKAATFAGRAQWVQAEMTARDALQSDPACVVAHHVIGLVAQHLGLRNYAASSFEAALKINAYFKPAKKALAALGPSDDETSKIAASSPAAHDRFLVIREWGYGFWADVDFALGQLLLAEFTGRRPVVFWGNESRFRRAGSAISENAWTLYFEPIGTLEDVEGVDTADRYPPKWINTPLDAPIFNRFDGDGSRTWSLTFLNRPERCLVADFFCGVVNALPWAPPTHPLFGASLPKAYRWLALKYLRPQAEILADVRAFVDQHLTGSRTLACHVRALDKRGEFPDLDRYIDEVVNIADGMLLGEPDRKLFIMSDWAGAVEHFRTRHGPRVVSTNATRAAEGTGLHRVDNADGARLGREVLTDSLIAASCDLFLGMAPSTVSGMIQFLRDWPAGSFMVLGPYMLSHRNQEIYGKPPH